MRGCLSISAADVCPPVLTVECQPVIVCVWVVEHPHASQIAIALNGPPLAGRSLFWLQLGAFLLSFVWLIVMSALSRDFINSPAPGQWACSLRMQRSSRA